MTVEDMAVLSGAGAESAVERAGEKAWLTRAAEALPVLALVIYGAVRFGDSAFYARLGVSPDEVGLDYGRTLGRVAVGIALLAAAASLVAIAGGLLEGVEEWTPRVVVEGIFGVIAWLVGLIALRSVLPPMSPVLTAVCALLIFFAGYWLTPRYRSGDLARSLRGVDSIRALGIAAAFVIALFGLAGVAGYRAAGYIVDGRSLPCGCAHVLGRNLALPWVNGSEGFMGLEAEHATVSWVTTADRPRGALPQNAVLLGDDDGIVVLYDVDHEQAVRLPADDVSVRTDRRLITWR
jgi:hypothetical protein